MREEPSVVADRSGPERRPRQARDDVLTLDLDDGRPIQLSPTDIAQYIRLDQCRRYLRLRLLERNQGTAFLRAWGVQPQSIPPLLTRSGRVFESQAETAIDAIASTVVCSPDSRSSRGADSDVDLLREIAAGVPAGGRVVVFQPLLRADIDGWRLTGIADAIDLRRNELGELSAFIVDFKSTTAARMEHRLQIAFYREMVEAAFGPAGISAEISLGVLYRGAPSFGADDEDPALAQRRADAWETFGVAGYLERIEEPEALRRHVRSLVFGPESEARRNLAQPFTELPFHLNYVCDGCLYNQFCLRQAAETDDLSLVPFLTVAQKQALRIAGVRRAADLAAVPLRSETWSDRYRTLAEVPALGADLDDLILRARGYRASKGDSYPRRRQMTDGPQSSLPRCDAEFHPNLVRVYVDVEHDYLHDRVYLLGALVVGAEGGETKPERRRTVIELADGPPDSPEAEAALLRRWVEATIGAVVDVAAPDADGEAKAPVHLIFYDSYDQRVLLAALGRHLSDVVGATALYDFATQLAAYTSPVLTVLADEVRSQRNYPLLCQTVQSLARFLKFPWDAERPLTELFRERYFDVAGRFDVDEIPDGDTSPWYTKRARFSSQLPLEYAYAAWGHLPSPEPDDPFRPFRDVTVDDLVALHEARLAAAEWIAADLRPNRWAQKASFDLPKLSAFRDIASSFAGALDEFITIERHLKLAEWKRDRAIEAERRVLAGTSMLVRYEEDDQAPAVAAYNRALYDWNLLPEEERATTPKPAKPDGPLQMRLRVDLSPVACSEEHALSLWDVGPGASVVISPRSTVDSRKPVAERTPFSPTIRQLLTGAGAKVLGVERDSRADGTAGYAIDIEIRDVGGKHNEFAFAQPFRGFEPGGLATIDESPNDWYGSFRRNVVDGLRAGKPHALFDRIAGRGPAALPVDDRAAAAQERFRDGLIALERAGYLYGFEPSKHRLIGELSDAPTVLVQGPPGTGKSLTASFAVLARVQGAMAAGRDCRVLLACKTHAAVDELLRKLVEVLDQLAAIRHRDPQLWDQWFDRRLLDLPIFRFEPKSEGLPGGVIALDRHATGDERAHRQIDAARWCVVASSLGGVYRMAMVRGGNKTANLFGHRYCDLLVLDEASQIDLPEALMGALPLKDEGRLIVIGDHRQMPPIVVNDWDREIRRTFVAFRSYESLFLTLREQIPDEHQIRFQESFRVHADIAEFLRAQIYRHDGIAYFSRKQDRLPELPVDDPFVAAVLRPAHPLTVVVHDERESQQRNRYEQELMRPVLEALARHGFDPQTGLGVVVPHTAQRAGLREEIPALTERDPETNAVVRSAVDTVERFQGAERIAIVVGATQSDPLYLLANSSFLFDPRRLNVAISRARQKLVLVGSRSIFELFPTDEEIFESAQLWKNLLDDTCTDLLWEGDRHGHHVQVWGNRPLATGG